MSLGIPKGVYRFQSTGERDLRAGPMKSADADPTVLVLGVSPDVRRECDISGLLTGPPILTLPQTKECC